MKLTSLIGIAALAFAFTGCDVDVKESGKLPDVDVNVEPGRAPDLEVRGPDVDVTTVEKNVKVPDIDVKTKDVKVNVPDVDIKIPKENENEPAGTPE